MLRRTSIFLLMVGLGLTQACQASSHKDQGTRYLRFSVDGQEAYGILEGDQVRQLSGDLFGEWEKTETTHALADVTILVPSKNPSKVLALAGNYKSHIGDSEPNPYPEPFIKLPSSLLAHGGEVVQPADTDPVHYEAEVVIVIGKQARNVVGGGGSGPCPGHHLRKRHQRPNPGRETTFNGGAPRPPIRSAPPDLTSSPGWTTAT